MKNITPFIPIYGLFYVTKQRNYFLENKDFSWFILMQVVHTIYYLFFIAILISLLIQYILR